ncbi:MAG: Bax inhibitor-1 family protein [Cypionkella sp.]
MADFQTKTYGATAGLAVDAGLRAHMNKIYGLMSVAMLVTGGVAWGVGTTPALVNVMIGSPLRWVVLIGILVMSFALPAMINRMSVATAQLAFYVYAALFGVLMSTIFVIYTQASIAQTFLVTAIAFAGLSIYGYTTKRDLSAMGTFMVMSLWGLIVASIVNMFIASSALNFAISAFGVVIFAGLTAWDTQKIKSDYIAHARANDQEWLGKSAVLGALNLYLDFINMFMYLLRFMGNSRS